MMVEVSVSTKKLLSDAVKNFEKQVHELAHSFYEDNGLLPQVVVSSKLMVVNDEELFFTDIDVSLKND